ncbi:hypothetical protein [Streptomyces radicis]|uniref:Uncharacterized protein n=1 Tax=Streptomyces radicis TaxID=1750517 RepID=A0A3A9W5X2_9ACTN|nr:hypothetical protein [Streptomyces radicis]RKN08595.1 hypothetical protein D7319_14440 [Streptomyces radicis]RKN21753.1 hypothetical protein D7318_15395 [Streptomyces radicis]
MDEALLAALTAETGLTFLFIGNGGFGGGPVADVYACGTALLIETSDPDTGVKALLVRADSAERAAAVRDALAAALGTVWTERALRAQVEASLPEGADPGLVALVMAVGGAEPEPGTAALLRRARRGLGREVREAARNAAAVAAELAHDPMVVTGPPEADLEEVLRPAEPVDGEEGWVTLRPGVQGRAVPRPVTWLRAPEDDGFVHGFTVDHDWLISVVGRLGEEWFEEIWTTPDGRTALHEVNHPELSCHHLAVHGADAATVARLLTEAGANPLDAPPRELPRTAA